MKRIGLIVLVVAVASLVLFAQGCRAPQSPDRARRDELESILAQIQKPGVLTDSYEESPGYYDPTNREKLKVFISKYPDTEEAYLAEVWLVFAEPIGFDQPWERRKQLAAKRTEVLDAIISKTRRPAVKKMAKLLRVSQLFGSEDYAAFEEQINEILLNIREYETEKDRQFLVMQTLAGKPPCEIEPDLREFLIIAACDQGQFKRALAIAEEVQQKFPGYSRKHNVAGVAGMLRGGNNPYPKFR